MSACMLLTVTVWDLFDQKENVRHQLMYMLDLSPFDAQHCLVLSGKDVTLRLAACCMGHNAM
jgi:hypothetical protein